MNNKYTIVTKDLQGNDVTTTINYIPGIDDVYSPGCLVDCLNNKYQQQSYLDAGYDIKFKVRPDPFNSNTIYSVVIRDPYFPVPNANIILSLSSNDPYYIMRVVNTVLQEDINKITMTKEEAIITCEELSTSYNKQSEEHKYNIDTNFIVITKPDSTFTYYLLVSHKNNSTNTSSMSSKTIFKISSDNIEFLKKLVDTLFEELERAN